MSDKKRGDKTTLDIRNYNFGTKQIGKGISLSSEEADRLTNILLENDFGSLDELEKAVKRKKNFNHLEKTFELPLNRILTSLT